ncbi:MAG: glycoside hydrolase family 2 TIM barrel-domain containing protein [Mucinivorans sp.]
MIKKILLSLLALISLSAAGQRVVRNINRDWQFTPGYEVRRAVSEPINVPHTWNLDALGGKWDYTRGLMNYLRSVDIPKDWANKRVFIKFYGANQTADLYVNSKHVGTHKGGYTAFCYDISQWIIAGSTNSIWVRLTNATDLDVMPLVGDFNMYGGIYRDVELMALPAMHISPTDNASTGVYVTPTNVTDEQASFTVRAVISGVVGTMGDVRFYVRDGAGMVVDSVVSRVKIGPSGSETTMAMFNVAKPHLWNAVADPYMYRADVLVHSLDRTKKTTTIDRDSVGVNFGLRYFEVDGANQFFLNGKPLRIQGVARHQDWAMLGNAIYKENHERDIELMREMGVNMVRLSHYPQDPYFLDLCDKAGIMVWSEIPFVGPGGYRDKGYNDSQNFRDNGAQQLTEMIRQQYNHPSVIMWGLFNELTQRGDDPLSYLKSLNELAKDEDPSRLTVGASNQDGALNFVTDLVGFNMYLGWYSGMPADIGVWGASVRKDFPKLKVGISEYGAGASIYQHQDSLAKPVANSMWHPEGWQSYFHEQYWKVAVSKNYFWGTFVWNMFDFGAAHRTEGDRRGINDKGLVTFDRLVRKDAFYFYKANWNKEDRFVHIASRRYTERPNVAQTFTVYSPCEYVQLTVNGLSLTQLPNDGYGTFVWKNCAVRRGENTVEAISADGVLDSYTFWVKD